MPKVIVGLKLEEHDSFRPQMIERQKSFIGDNSFIGNVGALNDSYNNVLPRDNLEVSSGDNRPMRSASIISNNMGEGMNNSHLNLSGHLGLPDV